MDNKNELEDTNLEVKGKDPVKKEEGSEKKASLEASATADQFLEKLAEIVAQSDLDDTPAQTENIAVSAEEESKCAGQEKNMEELEKSAAEAELEAEAAKDKEAPFGAEKKEEDKKEDDKKEDKGEKKDAPKDPEPKKDDVDPKDCPACKKAVKALEDVKAKHPEVAMEIDPIVSCLKGDAKDIKPAMDAAVPAEAPVAEDVPPAAPGLDAALPPADPMAAGAEAEPEGLAPFANLVAVLDKKATVADSVWMIKNAADNSDFVSFNIKAAFGNDIDKDEVRAAYATSQEFGKAVIASLIGNKVDDAIKTKAAVLEVAAHYNPSYAGAKEYNANTESSFPKASGEGDTETDKNLVGKEVKAQAASTLTKTAAEGASEDGKLASDATLLPGADSRSEKVNTNVEKSATPTSSVQVEEETDRKLVASYKEQLQKQASENEALKKQVEALKLEAALKDKTAQVKECVSLMSSKGFIKPDEQVRVASLREGLSIEAANGRAMAASLDKQAKYLFGMNSTQLTAYMNSLRGVSAPAVMQTAAAASSPLTIKASAEANEEERLLKVMGWDK